MDWKRRQEWKRNMFKLADTVHEIMLDGQSEEQEWSEEKDVY
jgi:hypothetical protein